MSDPSPVGVAPRPLGTPPPSPPRRRFGVAAIVLMVLGGIVVLGVLFFVMIWRMTSGPADAADRFFKVTAAQGPAAAWATASPAFQAAAPQGTWIAYSERFGLAGYKSSSWNDRKIENNAAEVKGSITLANGAVLPLTVDLVGGGNSWQVQSIDFPGAGLQTGTSSASGSGTAPAASAGAGGLVLPAPSQPPAVPGSAPDLQAMAIPAAKVAGMCMANLAMNAHVALDGAECFDGLNTAIGATTRCNATKDGRTAGMTVRLDRYDPVSKHAEVTCTVDNQPM